MALEPLGSIMSMQTQTVSKPEAVRPVTSSTEATVRENLQTVDATTIAVASTGKTDDGASDNRGEQQPSNDQIRKAVEQINRSANNSEVMFGIHDKTHRVTIKIVDKQTKEIIKELPPEKTLDMIAKAWELAGLLVDEKL